MIPREATVRGEEQAQPLPTSCRLTRFRWPQTIGESILLGIDYAVTVDLRNLTVVMSLQPCLFALFNRKKSFSRICQRRFFFFWSTSHES